MTGFIDPVVILLWLTALTFGSLYLSGAAPWSRRKSRSAEDVLDAHHDLPAWAICLSIVATETSTLTVISVPGIAYQQGMVFVGLGGGYLLGRIAVARFLLPLYMRGDLTSAYQYLALRFGRRMQRLASVTFLVTRLLAESVRLFASTIPICALLAARGMPLSPLSVLIGLTALTALYTGIGGLRAVVWSDAAQFLLYTSGAALCVILVWHQLSPQQVESVHLSGRLLPFAFNVSDLTSPYTPLTALVGGAVLAMASHGADQLMVQRALAARSLRDAQRAMVGSAFVVTLLFALLSLVGVFLWARHDGQSLEALGFHSPDGLFPRYIVDELPAGLSGLLVAGIISATMGSLSSALNAMTASTFSDLLGRVMSRVPVSRIASVFVTVLWALALIGAACAFSTSSRSALVFGFQIAGYSYGALLGAFLLGMIVSGADEAVAMTAFLATVIGVALIIGFVHPGGAPIAFPWLVPIGVAISFLVGVPLSLVRKAF
ncbi:sodium:solute symporter [Acetobacter oeni]|uniref:Sodium:solute symporter n=1 Tax=Acetobacter oeni TaxID=304077 RepID=A0A511XN61_9PROT|nr:sodium:solute symporter [Acetobacter oeni]MBB3884214.1 Na+/proline symporter [Acetobacter oeni]NHO20192.1 sodium:proline symporter [Acetobacter oeni]GBR05572.1 symporter of Na+/proline [Acetobacter oeni LMG 21952]GEN64365.1 sodium:solute symporter [Acetobacter oeni]